jgi:hypothetical protein
VEDLARRLASGGEVAIEHGGIMSRLLSAFGQRN